MDKNSRNKATEGGSSDEEEAFESADEGEEGSKNVNRAVATSADIRSANSTLKESVGKNDTSTSSEVTSGDGIKPVTAELGMQNTKMDENIALEKNEDETSTEKKPESSVDCEGSPSTEVKDTAEIVEATGSSKTVEEDASTTASKSSEDELTATESEKDNITVDEDKLTDHGVTTEQEQGQTTVNQIDVVAKDRTEGKGNNEAAENSEKEQQTVITESNADDKVEDFKRDR